jgi:3-mercaptopyruvate sulfurtransferase SseA
MKPLLDVAALQARLGAGRRTVLLDVRWVLGDPHGHEHYLAGHLPGAVFVDLASELSDPAVPDPWPPAARAGWTTPKRSLGTGLPETRRVPVQPPRGRP